MYTRQAKGDVNTDGRERKPSDGSEETKSEREGFLLTLKMEEGPRPQKSSSSI
jgi:hypothetical protein